MLMERRDVMCKRSETEGERGRDSGEALPSDMTAKGSVGGQTSKAIRSTALTPPPSIKYERDSSPKTDISPIYRSPRCPSRWNFLIHLFMFHPFGH